MDRARTRRRLDRWRTSHGSRWASTDPQRLFDDVLARAIPEVRAGGIDVFTFPFHHDHESAAVSICADMEASSARLVRSQNAFNITVFRRRAGEGRPADGSLFKANIGRSLSLGDFGMVNVARTDLGRIRPDDRFYLSMIRALRRRERDIVALSRDPQCLLFCASSADDEVGHLWTAEAVGE